MKRRIDDQPVNDRSPLCFLLLIFTAVSLLLAFSVFTPRTVKAQSGGLLLHVDATVGEDSNTCGSAETPCRTIQKAISAVPNGGSATILVAAGVYVYGDDNNPCYQYFGNLRAVACIINRQIVLQGGYASRNWTDYNPTANPTYIDGQNQTRGIYVASVGPITSLNLSGFTLRNGRHNGANSDDLGRSSAFGGAILLDQAYMSMRDLVFESNVAHAGNASRAAGGVAHGGAVAIRHHPGTIQIENVVFRNNRAEGGAGLTQGGFAYGGALYLLEAKAELNNVQFYNNAAASGARQQGDVIAGPFGGAMCVQGSAATLRNILFDGNRVEVAATNAPAGDPASGGALAIRETAVLPNPDRVVTLENIVFVNNSALGGNGGVRGGFALGGALYTYKTIVVATGLEFRANTARAGASVGQGRYANETGDGVGGAAAFQVGSIVTIDDIVAYDNAAFGGSTSGEAGGAFGGVLKAEGTPWYADAVTNVTIQHGDFRHNRAVGANGANGGLAQGGAIETLHASLSLLDSKVVQNYSMGGNGTAIQGAAGGGGLTLGNITNSDSTVTLINNLIANNEVKAGTGPIAGGGGGGIWLQSIRALLEHNTIAQNRLLTRPLQGAAIVALNDGATGSATSSVVTMNYNIIAEHDVDSANNVDGNTALFVKASSVPGLPANRIDLRTNLFSHNTENFNTFNVGVFSGVETSILADDAGFVAAGEPDFNYDIGFFSAAVNAAVGSASAADLDGDQRSGVPDVGAWEAEPFTVRVFPIGDGALRVEWGSNAGVDSYDMTVTCQSAASAPNEVACGETKNYPGSATGATLTGLTNGRPYGVAVSPLMESGAAQPVATLFGIPANLFVRLPLVTR